MSTLFERMTEGRRRALAYLETLNNVGTRYVIEHKEGVACLDPVTDEVHEIVEEFDPPEHPLRPGQYYDFITGIEQMRDGGPQPDWTGCGKAYEIRGDHSHNPLRFKYEEALSQRGGIEVLYNPSNMLLHLYPDLPCYFTHTQHWHSTVSADQRLRGRTILEEVGEQMCIMSFDTWDGTSPDNWKCLVPHPEHFRRFYPSGEMRWDGQEITYQWTSFYDHRVRLNIPDYYYYSTAQTDQLLQIKGGTGAYWLFQSSCPRQIRGIPDQYRPSFFLSVADPPEWDWEMPYAAYAKQNNSYQIGVNLVDLDQVSSSPARTQVACYSAPGLHIGGLGDGREGWGNRKFWTLVHGDSESGQYIVELGMTLIELPARYYARKWWIDPSGHKVIAIFADYDTAVNHFLSVYWQTRRRLRTIPTTYIDTQPLPLGGYMEPAGRLVDLITKATPLFGSRSMEEWKVQIRRQGGMVVRMRGDRYVMRSRIPYAKNSDSLWNFLNTSRMVSVHVDHYMGYAQKKLWLKLFQMNSFVSYWDDQVFHVVDPYSNNSWVRNFTVEYEDYTAPNYAFEGGERLYYPFKDPTDLAHYFGTSRYFSDGQEMFYVDDNPRTMVMEEASDVDRTSGGGEEEITPIIPSIML